MFTSVVALMALRVGMRGEGRSKSGFMHESMQSQSWW